MSLAEKLVTIDDEVHALLEYANGETGVDDTNLGEAVRRLASGGGGGFTPLTLVETVSLSADSNSVQLTSALTGKNRVLVEIANPISTINNGIIYIDNGRPFNRNLVLGQVAKSAVRLYSMIDMVRVTEDSFIVNYYTAEQETGNNSASITNPVLQTAGNSAIRLKTDGRNYFMSGMTVKVYA